MKDWKNWLGGGLLFVVILLLAICANEIHVEPIFGCPLTSQACEGDSTEANDSWRYGVYKLVTDTDAPTWRLQDSGFYSGLPFGLLVFDSLCVVIDPHFTKCPPSIPIIDTTRIDTVAWERKERSRHETKSRYWCLEASDGECLFIEHYVTDSIWTPQLHYTIDTIGYRLTDEQVRRLR